jgi:DnaK suppressor protein
MKEAQIEQFRQRLLQLRAELLSSAESSRETTRPVELDQARVGRLSRMDAMQGQEMAQEAARRREAHLVRIEAALRRIEAGGFGYCYLCGEEIAPRRFEADPTATRCIVCKEA